MLRVLAVPLAILAFHTSARPLTAAERADVLSVGEWHRGCPVPLSGLRILTVPYWGWGGSWTGSTHDYMHFSATGH